MYRTMFVAVLAAMLSACGGSSSSSAPVVIPSSDQQGVNVPTQVVGACAQKLEDVLDANTSNLGVRLANLNNGCDYLVDEDITIRDDIVIEAGVVIVLGTGVNLTFRTAGVELAGTAAAPIVFQSVDLNSPFGTVDFTRGVTMSNSLFLGGGAVPASSDDKKSMVVVTASNDNVSITQSSFTSSLSTGLVIKDTSSSAETFLFDQNAFSSNADVGLEISNNFINFVGSNNNFVGANGIDGVRIDGRYISGQLVKNIGVPYFISDQSVSGGSLGGLSITSSAIEAGVEFVVPNDANVSVGSTLVNGTSVSPVVFRAQEGSTSGWGGLEIGSKTQVRNLVVNDAGSVSSEIGGAVSVSINNDVLENITINNSRSWGLVCENVVSSRDPTIQISGLAISAAATGDMEPNCDVLDLPLVADAERRDARQCNEIILAEISGSSTPPVFVNSSAECDYYVVGSLGVGEATIQPGTTMIFARGASLGIGGFIQAAGTAAEPITLMGEEASDGYWEGLSVSATSFNITNTVIENGGVVNDAGLTLISTANTFQDEESFATVADVQVSGSLGSGLKIGKEIQLQDFKNNLLGDNAEYGLIVPLILTSALDSSTVYGDPATADTKPGIRLSDVSQVRGGQHTLSDLGVAWSSPLLSLNQASFFGSSNSDELSASLTLEAGVKLFFDENSYVRSFESSRTSNTVGPLIDVKGTMDNPVTISGPASNPTAWQGLFVDNFRATHLTLIGGGLGDDDTVVASENPYGVSRTLGSLNLSTGSIVNLDSVTIKNSRDWAIDCRFAGAIFESIANMTYIDNAAGDVNPLCGS